jgi:XTP/dITP diphosphohydrolase
MRVLVLSPRIPSGLMTASAWDAVRSASQVVSAGDGPHLDALREAGVDVAIGPVPSDPDAIWIPEPGDVSWARAWAERMLDSSESIGEPDDEFEVITGSFDPVGAKFLDLVEVMRQLRRDCAWTQTQTHESLAPYLVEEAAETSEAIASGDRDPLREELGDVLMQVVFHAAIAQENELEEHRWDVDDVAAGITEKLIRRNPHVFAPPGGRRSDASTIDEIAAQWERIKSEEKSSGPSTTL